jgi:hypothetical protein
VTKSFNSLLKGKSSSSDKHLLDGITKRPSDLSDLLTQVALVSTKKENKQLNESLKFCQYLSMCFQGTESFINSKLKIKENA